MGRQVGKENKLSWEERFFQVNRLAIQALGENVWTTVVLNCDRHMQSINLQAPDKKCMTFLALGLYLGALYGQKIKPEQKED